MAIQYDIWGNPMSIEPIWNGGGAGAGAGIGGAADYMAGGAAAAAGASGYGAGGYAGQDMGTGINMGQIPLSQVRAPDGSYPFANGGSGSYSESYSQRTSGGASGSYQSGNKYAGVGSVQSYTPNYGLNYTAGPVGQAYTAAMQKIATDLGSRPTYDNKYDVQLEAAYKNIVERDPFRWEADTDPFYQQYKRRYTQLGQQAMKDTMGQAAALTGGYASSYGQFAGQSAYNQYMSALEDRAIELEDRAYTRWRDAGDDLYKQYALLGDLRDTEYGRYRDAVSDYNYNLALLQAQEAEDYARAQYLNNLRIQEEQTGYSRQRDAMADARYEDELGYSRWRDQVSDARYEDELAYSRQRDAIEDDRWAQEFALKQMQAADSGSGSSRSGGGRSSGGSGYSSSGSGSSGYSSYSYGDFPEEIVGHTAGTTSQASQPIYGNVYSEAQQQWLEDSMNRGYVDDSGVYHDPVVKIRTTTPTSSVIFKGSTR